MKKLILLMLCMVLAIAPAIYAGQETTDADQEDPTIPPMESYKYSMSRDDIRDLLGLPDEHEDDQDTFYDFEYMDVLGHLIIRYEDDQVDAVIWESPELKDAELDAIVNAMTVYYDDKIGTDEEVKYELTFDDHFSIIWTDKFDKTEYEIDAFGKDGKIYMGMQRSLDYMIEDMQNMLEESGITIEDIMAEAESLAAK